VLEFSLRSYLVGFSVGLPGDYLEESTNNGGKQSDDACR
jgi:hypothetical protein